MKTCPSCSYSGFVNKREMGCADKLHCEVCDNQNWLDSDLLETYRRNSWSHRVSGAVQRTTVELMKLLFTEPCPQCGAYISKDGGCNSVICGRCRHQFCWECLTAYPQYQHTEQIGMKTCPMRGAILVLNFAMLISFLVAKVLETSQLARDFTLGFFVVFAYICGAIFYIYSFCFHMVLFDNFKHSSARMHKRKGEFAY